MKYQKLYLLLSLITLFFSCNTNQMKSKTKQKSSIKLNYPKTKQGNVTDTYFGIKVPDPYRWLEDDRSKETEAWVKPKTK